jgi:hypothetical protein
MKYGTLAWRISYRPADVMVRWMQRPSWFRILAPKWLRRWAVGVVWAFYDQEWVKEDYRRLVAMHREECSGCEACWTPEEWPE